MLFNKNPVERYRVALMTQRINWGSFDFIIETIDETYVNMINHLFNIISTSDLKSVCLKYLNDEKGGL